VWLKKRRIVMSKKRFKKVYSQGGYFVRTKILVDTETGINYLFSRDLSGGGMTVLLDKDGKPVITPVESINK
jgi:hypothetical protein